MASLWAMPEPRPESTASLAMNRVSWSSWADAVMTLAAADTARSSEAVLWEARRTSRMTVVRSCHGISSWRTMSSSRRAVDGQCTRRRSSPTTYSRSE